MDIGEINKRKTRSMDARVVRKNKKKRRKMEQGRSQIWLLQARAFEDDQRTAVARDMKVYLVPGREYTLGKNAKVCDIAVLEDKSVSGTHAKLRVCVDGDDGEGHVLVTDTSTWGTSISKDGKNIHAEDKLGKGCVGKAYHGYLVKFGVFSPFQLMRVDIPVYLGHGVNKEEITMNGLEVVEDVGEEDVVMVVGEPEVAMEDDVLLALVIGVPLVTMDWVRAWSKSTWIGDGPPVQDYAPRIKYRDGYLDLSRDRLSENQEIMEYVFVFPWEDGVSEYMKRILEELGVHYCQGTLDGTFTGQETPVVVLHQELEGTSIDVASMVQSLCLHVRVEKYCLWDDIKHAIVYGGIRHAIRPVGESEDGDDGWHDVDRGTAPSTTASGRNDENITVNNTSVVVDKALVRQIPKMKKPTKGFVKRHISDPGRDVIELEVMGIRSEAADNDEWAAMEREKMEEKLRQDAFDRGGKKPVAKKRTRKNTKKT